MSDPKMTSGGITFGPPGRGPQHIEIAQALEVDVKRWRQRAEAAESERDALRAERDRLTVERDEATALANQNGAEADENAIALAESRAEVERLTRDLRETRRIATRLFRLWDGTLHGNDFWNERAAALNEAEAALSSSTNAQGGK